MKLKSKILAAAAVFTAIILVPLVWMAVNDVDYASLNPMTRAKRSTLVVYAVEKREGNDESLVIQDVWKDARKSQASLIGAKIQIKVIYSPISISSNQIPAGAVVFFEGKIWDKSLLEPRYFGYANGGKIEGMTLDEYKKACGL